MPIFQKKTAVPSNGAASPHKASPKPQARGATGTGGRHSLTMVGKALAEVVNSRKPIHSPKSSGRSLAKLKEVNVPLDRPYDSSTGVESSSTAVSLLSKATGNIKTTPDAKATPRLALGLAASKLASGSPTSRGSPQMKSRKLSASDSSPTPSLSLGRSSSMLIRRPGHAVSPSVTSITTTTGTASTSTAELSSVTKFPGIKSRAPAVSPTLGRKSKHSPSLSTSSIPNSIAPVNVSPIPESTSSHTETCQIPTRANSIRSKLPSSLPQPKSRPKSGIFSSVVPAPGTARPKATTAPLQKRVRKEHGDDVLATEEMEGESLKDSGAVPRSDANSIVDRKLRSDKDRDSSPTPSIRQPVHRPFSPLPKRVRSVVGKVTSGTTTSVNGDNVFGLMEPSKSSTAVPDSSTRPPPVVSVRGTGLPRPGVTVSSRARGQSLSGNELKSLSIKGAASQPQVGDRSSPPSPQETRAKRRKSDEPPSSFADPNTRTRRGPMHPSSSRLSVPSMNRSRPSHPAHSHLQLPKTPSTSKPLTKIDHTFSIPRNRMISFTFADMTMPDIPDDDDTSLSFDMTHFNGDEEDAHSPKSMMSPLPTIFLPPTQQFTSTPSRLTRGKKKRPSLHPSNAPGSDRQSILSWDTIVERSREYQEEDEAEVGAMLSDVRAPFTPDVRSPSMSTSVSEASFNLNVADAELLAGPASPLDVSFDGSVVTPNSIAQMLFPSAVHMSESTSPTTSQNALPDPLSPNASPGLKSRALETELIQLRLRLAARDSAAQVQASRLSTLESELATIHSVTRDREVKHRASIYRLACEAASKCIHGVKKEWDLVASVAHGEMDAITGDRFALQAISESLTALQALETAL
ncbi:hypothetical protein BS47DRAFT_508581 [Hydnum rufescens UP504]|uniref:Uncharacterized protein n=1 Tax=Hydnum rufescens UP504 TaxID=1448309 RepID=A0A9P6DXL2_9AGAM|nr:hypothetical protein BS47DRAFT_508581 [Hydnum rufescens UP504]